MTEIKPRINENGKPVCDADTCPMAFKLADDDCADWCHLSSHGDICVPALLQGWAKLEAVRERNDKLRKLADESAHESGVYARRMGEAQIEREKLQAEVEQLRERAEWLSEQRENSIMDGIDRGDYDD